MTTSQSGPSGDVSQQRADLLLKLEYLRNTLISVSTGGKRIQEANAEYQECYFQVTEDLKTWKLPSPVPYSDLWEWYGKWSSGDLPTYRSRREYIRGLFEPIEKTLRESPLTQGATVFPEPTGWTLVDRKLDEARKQLESASTEEQFQAVGLYCRETLICLAQTVFEPELHPPVPGDDKEAGKADAKRMLDRYLAVELGGGSNEVARRHAKSSLDLANELQHQETAAFRKAALCAQATASVVNIVAILSGVRDPNAGTFEPSAI